MFQAERRLDKVRKHIIILIVHSSIGTFSDVIKNTYNVTVPMMRHFLYGLYGL